MLLVIIDHLEFFQSTAFAERTVHFAGHHIQRKLVRFRIALRIMQMQSQLNDVANIGYMWISHQMAHTLGIVSIQQKSTYDDEHGGEDVIDGLKLFGKDHIPNDQQIFDSKLSTEQQSKPTTGFK